MSKLADARRSRRSRLAIVLTYAAVSICWIAVSDALVNGLPVDLHEPVSTVKGILFVAVTGGLLWMALVARDAGIERQRTVLARSEERHRLLAERQHDVVYRFRILPTPGFEYVSPSIEAISGHTPEEHYADPSLGRDLVHPDDRALLASATAGGEGPVLVRWLRRDGGVVYTEHRVTPVKDGAGNVLAVEGVARDVTARVQADEQYRRLAIAIDATPAAVAVLTRRGDGFEAAYANSAMTRLTGLHASEAVGGDLVDLLARWLQVTGPALRERLAAGEPFQLDASLRLTRGAATPVTVMISPMAGDGGVDSVVAVVLDRRESVAREAAEARLGLVLNASPAPIVVTDPEGVVTEWNPAAERVFGWSSRDVLGRPFPLLPDDARAAYRGLRDRLAAGEVPAAAELTLRHRDGRRIPCRIQAALVPADGATGIGMVGVIEDLSAQIEQQHAQARLASAIDAAGEAILITTLDGTITYVNPAFERVSGYTRDELIGRNPRVLQSGLTSAAVFKDLWSQLAAGRVWRGVLVNRRKDGSIFEEEATLSPVFGGDGKPIAYVGVKRDLTLERTLAEGLASELNDRAAVQETMARLELGDTPEETALLLCEALAAFPDVDGALLQHLPPGDGPSVLIGVAGDAARTLELGHAVAEDAALAVRLRAAGGAWSTQQQGVPPTPFAGTSDADDLTVVAAPVRHRGKPVAVLYLAARCESPDTWVARYLRIASELAAHIGPMVGPQLSRRDLASASTGEIDRIIETGAFSVWYQPVCDLATGVPVGWESLTRFADGVAPSRRFADATAVGLGPELELACGARAIQGFGVQGHRGWLAINLSPAVVLSGRAEGLVAGTAHRLVLELTEPLGAGEYDELREVLGRLEAPPMIAVDDTGAGYSGLRQVLALRPDFLKLDLGLVHDIDRDTARQAMVAGMAHAAAQSGTRLIAEGVETEAERRTLSRLGVAFGQGLLLGPPSATGMAFPPTPRSRRRDEGAGAA